VADIPGAARFSEELPGSILFACTHNAIRSPIAEAVMKVLHGRRVYVDSVGVRPQPIDPFAIAALDEIGIDLSRHRSKSFDELEDDYFDLVISLSPEAQHRAVELTRTSSCEIEFWPTMDPSLTTGSREQRLDAYRTLRDELMRRLGRRFPPAGAPIMA
jgi:protein-tyrosine-phosphatase